MDREVAGAIEDEARFLADDDPRRRVAAVRTLTELATQLVPNDREQVVELVDVVASDQQPFVRWNVAIAVGEIGHPKGVEVLGKLLGDPHANVRLRVALSLGLLGQEIGVPALEKMIYDT